MKANVGKGNKIILWSIMLFKMMIRVKPNIESDFNKRLVVFFEFSWISSCFCVHLHVTEFLVNLSYSSLLITWWIFLKIQVIFMHFLWFLWSWQLLHTGPLLNGFCWSLLNSPSGVSSHLSSQWQALYPWLCPARQANLLHDQSVCLLPLPNPVETSHHITWGTLTFWASIERAKWRIPEYEVKS